jgi:hypothetical protein
MTSNIDYTDDTLSYVITDGIRFLQSLTQHYGAERGMEVWEKLGEVMGPEIKGQVFFLCSQVKLPRKCVSEQAVVLKQWLLSRLFVMLPKWA